MLLSEGVFYGKSILEPVTVRAMKSMHITDKSQDEFDKKFSHLSGYTYGNLMRILKDSSLSATIGTNGEFGWDGWLGTFMLVDPANQLAVVYFMQLKDAGFTPTARKIKNVIYSALC